MYNIDTVKIVTEDGVEIIGDHYKTREKDTPCILMLHMMPSNRESWKSLAIKLREKGYQSLAIDLRGHGDSIIKNDTRIDYLKFNDQEQQDKRLDVESSLLYLEKQGIDLKKIGIIGASIGANLAIEYLFKKIFIKTAILLSPGLDYRGIKTIEIAKNIKPNKSIFIVVSEEDEYSFTSSKKLYNTINCNKKIEIYRDAGHGTTMLFKEKELDENIIDWFKTRI